MAVPNTTNFSFIDVKNEIENNGGVTINSLVDAFNNATPSSFDSNYEGAKNNLLNFRNYQNIVNTISLDAVNVNFINHYFFKINSYGSTLNTLTVQFDVELENYDTTDEVAITSLDPGLHERIVLNNSNQSQTITFSVVGEYAGEIASNVDYNDVNGPSSSKGYIVTMTLLSASVNGIPNPNSISHGEGTFE